MAKLRHPSDEDVISTTAELFPDGAAIDLLRNGQLLFRHGDREETAAEISHNGNLYRPAGLDLTLEAALRLPTTSSDYGTVEDLVRGMSDQLREILGGADNHLLSLFSTTMLSTSLGDCLPGGAPVLNLWGPEEYYLPVAEIVMALCRRPLQLMDASLERLAALPRGLHPTLILTEPRAIGLPTLLRAAHHGGGLLRGGCLLMPRCSLVVFTELPSPLIDLRIPLMALAPKPSASAHDIGELENHFAPMLLRHRLDRHQHVANSRFATEGLASGLAVVARQLGAAVEGANDLQENIVEALATLDEERKSETCQSDEAVAVEAVLVVCHEQKASASVSALSEIANTIALGRGERAFSTPKIYGAMLRRMGLRPRRQSSGFVLTLDGATSRRVHELGCRLGVLSLVESVAGCNGCGSISGADAGPDQSGA